MMIYTVLSLAYAVLTEGIFLLFAYGIFRLVWTEQKQPIEFQKAGEAGQIYQRLGTPLERPYNNQNKGALMLTLLIFLIGVGSVLFAVYFLFLTRHISTNLSKIMKGIRLISNGDLSARIHIHGEDEFAMIGEQFNVMAEELSKLMESERKIERTKNNLITNVAHDLRTPLTSIIGYLDLTRQNADLDEASRQRYISIAYDKAKRLEKLIGDLFNYTKFSSGEVVLNPGPMDLVKFVEQMIDEFYPLFMDAGLTCRINAEAPGIMIEADGDLLARAFSNLLSNAAKYGKDGKKIAVAIRENRKWAMVSITNYGKIIPQEELEFIFDRFYRVENSRNSETGGTGLGLAIARSVVLMHGGRIQVSSGEEGTVFEVSLRKEV